jgi:hypothetical protein
MNAWTIFDNSSDKPKRIAYKEGGRLRIVDSEMFAGLLKEKGTHGKKK